MSVVALKPAGLGDNSEAVPLAEMLADETESLRKRAEELAASAGRAKVTDDESAGRAALLVKLIREHRDTIEKAREARKAPFLANGRTVDAYFASLDCLLAKTDGKKRVIGGPLADVTKIIDDYRRAMEEKARAERLRLESEARKQREAAEVAERQRRETEAKAAREAEEALRKVHEAEEAAKRAGDREAAERATRERAEAEARESEAREQALLAELAARQRQEEAERLERQAQATKAAPIDSGFGVKAVARKNWHAEITDLKAALRHCMKVDPAAIQAAVQSIFDRQVRAGVRDLPGAEVKESSSTVVR